MTSQGLTVCDLRALKGKRRITYVQVASAEEAAAAAAAGMDMIGSGFRPDTLSFVAAAKGTHFQFGLAWGKHASATEALRDAMSAMEAGAQSIYCAMSAQVIEVLAREGIPVIAHAGLVPPKATWTGGYRAVGKTRDQAIQVWQEVKRFESAGAFAIELEVIPAALVGRLENKVMLSEFVSRDDKAFPRRRTGVLRGGTTQAARLTNSPFGSLRAPGRLRCPSSSHSSAPSSSRLVGQAHAGSEYHLIYQSTH